ncbi:MAG: FAD-binding oxidoreductase [Saprospiraceae bacterium]|nr:FAD-binding oxidoreductase [Saprospiraceae bacterium]
MNDLYFDQIIIGGGIFGIYTALHLASRRMSVLLIEKDARLFQRASAINQARLHGGYHYPRSIATARIAQELQLRFVNDHRSMINQHFKQFYAVDKSGSFTTPDQFMAFCHYLNIPLKEVAAPSYFKAQQMEALFLTEEYSFDCTQLSEYYQARILQSQDIVIHTNTMIKAVSRSGTEWQLQLQNQSTKQIYEVCTRSVINATYSGINAINRLFGLENLDITHELAEVVLAISSVKNVGLTIIDGDFSSFMPYGHGDLVSLSSVRYTSHYGSSQQDPTFPCQQRISACTPVNCLACNNCVAKPDSNQSKMMHQIGKYLSSDFKFQYLRSMYTIKSKLKSSYIDDSRPTLVKMLNQTPAFHCIFGGKISSIYEIENYFNA